MADAQQKPDDNIKHVLILLSHKQVELSIVRVQLLNHFAADSDSVREVDNKLDALENAIVTLNRSFKIVDIPITGFKNGPKLSGREETGNT